jgi:CheY-like chemotaxis protein
MPTIVMITAYGREEVIRQAEQVGLAAILIKPITPSILLETIMGVMGQKDQFRSVGQPEDEWKISTMEASQGARILLVEDNEINQQFAQELLEGVGFEVIIANNGREAVNAVQADKFDAVLMDVQMPVMDGYQATSEIRKHERFRDLPIIAMTAHAMAGDREKSLAAGMNDHITKPINPDHLFSTLFEWIQHGKPDLTPDIPAERKRKVEERDERLPLEMPGIELKTGLVHIGGNQALYFKLLGKFHRDYTDVTSQIKNALENREHKYAQHLAHTVKGVSANIGALDLEKASAALETAIRQEAIGSFENLLNQFDTALTIVLDSIDNTVLAETEKKDHRSQRPVADEASLHRVLSKLKPYVLDREARPCKKIMQEVAGFTWPDEYAHELKDLNGYIGKYKFKEAQELISQIIVRLER